MGFSWIAFDNYRVMVYPYGMSLQAISINRATGGTRYAEVIDACEEASANGECGSATNALIVMARQSPLFQQTLEKIKAAAAQTAAPAAETA